MIDVAVVGGGLSGLALATRVAGSGRTVRLFDAREEPGGNIQTSVVEAPEGRWLLELGPNSFGDASTELMALARTAGLEDALVRAPDLADARFLFCDGRLQEVPSKPPRMMLSSILPLGARLRLLKEPFVKPRPADAPEESLAAFCDRRLGEWARRRLLTPVVSGIYAGDPEQLGAESAFPKMVELEREHGSLIRAARKGSGPPSRGRLSAFAEGLASLPKALAARLGDAYRPGTAVEALSRNGEAWTVTTGDGEARARQVALATPAWVTARLLDEAAPAASAELDRIEYAPMVVAHVGVRREQLLFHPPGFGFLVPRNEGVRVLGVIFSSTLFPNRAPGGHELLTVFTGGALDPAAIAASDDDLRGWVLEDLGTALGLKGDPPFFSITRWPRAIPQYVVGHRDRLVRIDEAVRDCAGLHLLGNWRGGIAMPACVQQADAVPV